MDAEEKALQELVKAQRAHKEAVAALSKAITVNTRLRELLIERLCELNREIRQAEDRKNEARDYKSAEPGCT